MPKKKFIPSTITNTPAKNESLPDMSAWSNLMVPPPVLQALAEQKFSTPTPIQCLSLTAAIRDRMNIFGAAETGSGKTLAFGIPMIHRILELKEKKRAMNDINLNGDNQDIPKVTSKKEKKKQEQSEMEMRWLELQSSDAIEPTDSMDCDEDIVEDDNDTEEENSDEKEEDITERLLEDRTDKGEADQPPDEEEVMYSWKDDEIVPDEGLMMEEVDPVTGKVVTTLPMPQLYPTARQGSKTSSKGSLSESIYGLVITPTRELAVQVARHLSLACRHTDIRVGVVFGGMSMAKQERLLRGKPEIVVATPGRLWEFIENGEPHLNSIPKAAVLVIDEADRLVEKGHFAELRSIFNWISIRSKQSAEAKQATLKRQTFVFSATLTFVHDNAARMKQIPGKKNKVKVKLTEEEKMKDLMTTLGLTEKVKMIDVTQKVAHLSEWKLYSDQTDKDLYVFWFLRTYPGRTLLFCNSKSGVRRLASVLSLLRLSPLVLHADMHQKHRLKNLEKFTANENALLLATDVASRGLDIPGVEQVIHFDVPRTAELYLHRSGRTARAQKAGNSLVLVNPQEIGLLRKLCHSLKRREDELPSLDLPLDEISTVRPVVNLARTIDERENKIAKAKTRTDWLTRTAIEADLDIDEDLMKAEKLAIDSDEDESAVMSEVKAQITAQRRTLGDMISALTGSTTAAPISKNAKKKQNKLKKKASNSSNPDATVDPNHKSSANSTSDQNNVHESKKQVKIKPKLVVNGNMSSSDEEMETTPPLQKMKQLKKKRKRLPGGGKIIPGRKRVSDSLYDDVINTGVTLSCDVMEEGMQAESKKKRKRKSGKAKNKKKMKKLKLAATQMQS